MLCIWLNLEHQWIRIRYKNNNVNSFNYHNNNFNSSILKRYRLALGFETSLQRFHAGGQKFSMNFDKLANDRQARCRRRHRLHERRDVQKSLCVGEPRRKNVFEAGPNLGIAQETLAVHGVDLGPALWAREIVHDK